MIISPTLYRRLTGEDPEESLSEEQKKREKEFYEKATDQGRDGAKPISPNKFWMWIAWRLPRMLVYWCAIRVIAHATTGRYGKTIVSELVAMDALQRWNNGDNEGLKE